MLTIYTNGDISISGASTGLAVKQGPNGTIVHTKESAFTKAEYKEHEMPHQRYSLAADTPASGVAGRSEFEADVLALIDKLKA
jgi:hypothetical protein